MAIINTENRNPNRPIDLSKMKKVANKALRRLDLGKSEVNIVFVSNQRIRAMNRRYLGMDISTDVLAFSGGDTPGGDDGFLGDVVISSDKAQQQAKEYGTSFLQEMALYVIHGILHLAGYEDRTKKGKALMRNMEDELIQKTGKIL